MKKNSLKSFLFLHVSLIVYSGCSIFSKLASNEDFLSKKYIIFMIMMIVVLGIYAIMWQQILKRMSLNIAFTSKGITTIWGMIIGYFIFSEKITIFNILGSMLIMVGIFLLTRNTIE